ncbi:MAG: hypothetical protein WC273_07715 [Dehalococcoidia bacterium]
MVLLSLLVFGLGCGIAGMTIMEAKGRSAGLGLLLGLVAGPVGPFICAALAPSTEVAAVRFVDRVLREERRRGAQHTRA